VTSRPPAPAETPVLFPDQRAFADWLARHHASSAGLWLRLARKNALLTSISYVEALDVALCYGWIDSQKKAYDESSFLQRFTPRGPKSIWSKINRDKVTALADAGLMQPSGTLAVDRAKEDGRWDAAYDSQRNITVPPDLQAALDRNRKAREFFATLTGANRYAVLFRIHTTKRPETRANKIARFVEMLARHETLH
jgi:uncharacterized protein YdeI (YjbR/CyaY-like superfamily)